MSILKRIEKHTRNFSEEVEESTKDIIIKIINIINKYEEEEEIKYKQLRDLLIEHVEIVSYVLENIIKEIERRERNGLSLIEDWLDFKRTILEPIQEVISSLKEEI